MRVVGRLDLQRLHVGQLNLRHHADRRLQAGRTAALELQDFDVWVVDGVDRLLVQGLAHHLGHHRLDDLFAQRRGTDPGFDQRSRRLAGTEALDLGARREPVQHPLVGRVDHVRRHLDGHAELAFRELLRDDRKGFGHEPEFY